MSKKFISRKNNLQHGGEGKNQFCSRPFAPAPTPEVQAKSEPQNPEQDQTPEEIPSSDRLSRIEITPPNPIQPKLTIGAPGDKYEREADTVARKVVNQMNSPSQRAPQPEQTSVGESIQPKISIFPKSTLQHRETEAPRDVESSIQQARGSGQPISPTIRQPMERAFDADFSSVRIHANSQSDRLNQSIQAKAFTSDRDIFFRQGEYQPESQGGKELLAHELTHVVQQGGSTVQQKSKTTIQRAILYNDKKQRVTNRELAIMSIKTKGIPIEIATQVVERYWDSEEEKTIDELCELAKIKMQQVAQAETNEANQAEVATTENSDVNLSAPEVQDNTQNESEPTPAIGRIPSLTITNLTEALADREQYIPEKLGRSKSLPSPVTEQEWDDDQAESEKQSFYEALEGVLNQYRHSISADSDSGWEADDEYEDESESEPNNRSRSNAVAEISTSNRSRSNAVAEISTSNRSRSNAVVSESQINQPKPPEVQPIPPSLNQFKQQTTRKLLGKRGVYTKAIDNWIVAVKHAQAEGKEPPLQHLLDACEAWLAHHKGHNSKTVTKRRPVIENLARGLRQLLSVIQMEWETPQSSEVDGTSDVALEATGVATEWGQTGNIADVGLTKEHGNTSDIDVVEGLNILSGVINVRNALDKEDKVEAILQAADGVGQTAHGLSKLTKGILIKVEGVENQETIAEAAAYNDYTAIGDVGAGISDCISIACQTYELYQQLSSGQWKENKLETAKIALGTVDSALNTTKDIIKAIQEFGNNTQFSSAVSGLAQTSGALTAAISAIEGIQLAGQNVKAAKDNAQIKSYLKQIQQQKEQAKENLNEFGLQLESALKAKQKINNLTMDRNENLIKGTKVVAGVASGILITSGVGAPIVLPFVVIGAIAGLGYAGLKLGRNQAAKTAMNIGQRLTNEGQPQGKVDEIDYRTMEKRLFNCYYNHLSEVIKPYGQNPPGMSPDDFTTVKRFAWEDKKVRVASQEKEIIEGDAGSVWGQVDGLDNTVKRNNWVEVHINDLQNTVYKEKPKNLAKVALKVSPSAHKSSSAQEANINDIVHAVYIIGSQSFDPTENVFKPCPIIGVGNPANAENVPENVDSVELLTNLKIDADTWKQWRANSQNSKDATQIDETKMKEKIKTYVK